MNYNFYAGENDKLEIIEFIFNETDLKIYDFYSPYGEKICKYSSAKEMAEKFDFISGGKFALTFSLWSPRHKGKPIFRRIELNPKYCNGHTFRYSTDGLGMIHLYFGGIKNKYLALSNIVHISERRARIYESPIFFKSKVDKWNWKEINKTSRKIKYRIHKKMAVDKIGSIGVLKQANELRNNEITLC